LKSGRTSAPRLPQAWQINCGYRTAGHGYAEVAASDALAPRAAFCSGTRMCTNRAW